ncbi:MAG: AAA family ATPase, partial [Anaerovoracaceae bacterium]
MLTACSGKAAFNIRGTTLHTAFGIGLCDEYKKLSMEKLFRFKEQYRNLKVLVIDEVSMMGRRLLAKVVQRLAEIRNNSLPFGGLSVIALGDFKQLPPVMDKFVFYTNGKEILQCTHQPEELWKLFEVFSLDEIMRQKENLQFARLLTKIGEDNLIALNKEDVVLLDKRIIPSRNDIPDDAITLFHSNKDVEEYNDFKINSLPGELIEVYAQDRLLGELPKGKTWEHIRVRLVNAHLKKAGTLVPSLRLKIGVKYMIITNIRIEDGLVNGTAGILKAVTMENEEVKILWFDFMEDIYGRKTREEYPYKDLYPEHFKSNLTPLHREKTRIKSSDADKWS